MMTRQNVRLAIIGMGDMGGGHARGFNAIDGCELVAIAEPREERYTAHQIDWRNDRAPAVYTNHRELLKREKVDACIVAVPDLLHREVAEAALDAGCDLLLEKPVSTTLEDADAIIRHAKERNRLLQIGLVYRYSTLYRAMAKYGSEPGHGVRLMWCKELRQCFPQRDWFHAQEQTGGTLVEKDCHHFDIFNWVIGSDPIRVFATGGQHVWKSGSLIDCSYCPDEPRVIDKINTVDHAVVAVEYENGARASLILCMYLRPENVMPEGLEIGGIAESGRQFCAYQDQRLGIGGIGEPFHFLDLDMISDNEGMGHIGCQAQRRDFLDCVRERKEPFANGRIGRDSLLVALAAERSIEEGRPIELSELSPCLR